MSGQRKASTKSKPAKVTRPVQNTRHELVREKMLEQAAARFGSRGFMKTSMADIADALALKRSSLYHYFPNKEAMLREIFSDEFERRIAEMEKLSAPSGTPATERLRAVVEGAINQRLRSRNRFLVFDRVEPEIPDDLRRVYNRARRRILELYTQLIEEGIESGEFRDVDPKITAFALIGMSNWTALWYDPAGRISPSELAASFVDLLLRGISRPAALLPPQVAIEGAISDLKAVVDKLEASLK